MFTIGEFSKITSLSVKTLRFYHEKGILIPSVVDQESGYRYYDAKNADIARVIAQLRRLEFPLAEIKLLLENHDDDSDILDFLERRRDVLRGRMQNDRECIRHLDQILKREKEARRIMNERRSEVEEKTLQDVLMCGFRMKGKYEEIGKGFGKVGKAMGFNINGKAFGLYYDEGYKEEGADFEACMPIKKEKTAEGVDTRILKGGKALTLLHYGPYDSISRSYEKIAQAAKERGLEVIRPTREVYIKGPGMIFKGNPEKYVTEIQMLIAD